VTCRRCWGFVRQVEGGVGHLLAVSRATGVLAGVAGGEGVSPGDVSSVSKVELVLFVPRETVWDEDGELVGGVRVGAQERSKVKMGNVGALAFGAEAGASALLGQLGS
jgi:hypothetical protein